MSFTWLIGTLGIAKQDENLAQFLSDPNCKILLGSIQAARVGIDLRCAQNVYMMVRRKHFFCVTKHVDKNSDVQGTELESGHGKSSCGLSLLPWTHK
jgi:hypothetical protein